MSRNFGLKRLPDLIGCEDSAVAGWALIAAFALTLLLLALNLVL